MVEKPMKVAIINRSFWPVYPVIGEALLRFAENSSVQEKSVSVIMQDHTGIKDRLKEHQRGEGVRFYPVKALSSSASSVLLRALDAVFFMFWVIGVLLWVRPKRVYISTDPPVLVPFIVMLYSRCFSAEYIYHLQDIHPEAANVVISVNKWIYQLLLKMDVLSMRHAHSLITITQQMADEIRLRSATTAPIYVLDNPAVSFDDIEVAKSKIPGFSFCGNAGRLQRIPLVLDAIEVYFARGGLLSFTFAGGGIYAGLLQQFSERFEKFQYLGLVSPAEAAQVNADYTWALLPIEDEVTRFAFPSKSSSYVFSGAKILAVCGEHTSVAQWVKENCLGLVVKSDVNTLADTFFDIERGKYDALWDDSFRESMKSKLEFDVFVNALDRIVLA